MKKNKNENMDIFTKGFVKPDDDVEIIEIEEDTIEEQTNNDINNEIKYNSIKMKEKANEIINELEKEEEIRNNKKRKKNKIKNIFLILGIILEIVVIAFLYYTNFIKEDYVKMLTCKNITEMNNNNYSITTNNVYYFDRDDRVAKTENSIIYIFNNKNSYDKYKKEYIDTNIKNYDGIEQIDIFDDTNYAYENKTVYTYSKLKKNKQVKVNDRLITANIKDRKEPITIYIESYDNVLKNNEEMGFVCE